jgi:hypothetical protein
MVDPDGRAYQAEVLSGACEPIVMNHPEPADGVMWWKSSYSGYNSNCVEMAEVSGQVRVRDSKVKRGPSLSFSRADWSAFLAEVKAGPLG